MDNQNIAEDTKRTVLELVADLKDFVFTKPAEKGDLLLVEFFFSRMEPLTIINHIVKHVLPFKKHIQERNIQFFVIKKREIFGGLPADRVEYFASLVQKPASEGGMNDENKASVWAYFDTLAALAEKFKKVK